MKCIVFTNNAASVLQVSWVAEKDCVLVEAISSVGAQVGGQTVLSSDPSMSAALFTSPSEQIIWGKDQFLVPLTSTFAVQLNIPIAKGSVSYLAFSAAKQTAVLYIEE